MMRRLHLQMQISIDGFVSTGPDDDQSWVTWAWEEIQPQVLELIGSIDTILIGRKLAIDYIPHWIQTVKDSKDPMYDLASHIVKAKKLVFSKTLEKAIWDNTELNNGDLVQEVNILKKQNEKDIIVYGGSSFVSSLIGERLIDEFHLFVNPVVLGAGVPIFEQLKRLEKLNLKKTIAYPSGIVFLNYEKFDQ